jgi:four helix bundle protein
VPLGPKSAAALSLHLQSPVAGVRRFQELDAHKLAVELRRKVFRLTAREPVKYDYEFVRQIRNSARGAPRNIAEGFSRFVPSENRHFLSYAKASLDETKNHLADALDSQYLTQQEYADLLTLTQRTLAAVSGMMRYLESEQAQRAYQKVRNDQRRKWHRKRPEP